MNREFLFARLKRAAFLFFAGLFMLSFVFKKSVIVEECSYLLSGWCDVYVKSGPCFVTRLKGNIRTDDGYRPFSRNDYILAWYGDSVRIDYGTGNGQRRDAETFRLK